MILFATTVLSSRKEMKICNQKVSVFVLASIPPRITHPIPHHELHERKCEHPAVAQVSAHRQSRAQISIFLEQIRVCSQSEEDCQAHRHIAQPVFQSRQGFEGSGCDVGETKEREKNGDESGCFAWFVHRCDVRLEIAMQSVSFTGQSEYCIKLTMRIDSPSIKTTFWSTSLRGVARKNQAAVRWKAETALMSVYGDMRPIVM